MSGNSYLSSKAASFGGKPILLVEDNPLFVKLIEKAISSLPVGREIIKCATGSKALDLMADPTLRLDLALIDLGLPDISGMELIRALRKRYPVLPILVISVISAERSLLEAIRAGASGYIHKGDPENTVATAIADVMEGKYPISPSLARTLFRLAGAPHSGQGAPDYRLAPRELETLQLLSRGNSYEEVANLMGVAVSTVQSNIRSLYRKLNVHSMNQAVSKARDVGII